MTLSANSSDSQTTDVGSLRPVDLRGCSELAGRILNLCTQQKPAGGAAAPALPSERELARQLGVTRHALRHGLASLEAAGFIQRLHGVGTLILTEVPTNGRRAQEPAGGVRCINFIQGPNLQQPEYQFQVNDYLAGYTAVLDHYDVKTRFIFWSDDRRDHAAVMWDRAVWSDQACVLVNRREPGLLAWLNEHRVPFVVQNHGPYDKQDLPPHHRVYVNKTGATFEATRHLFGCGHQRVGFVGNIPPVMGITPEYDGYIAAVRCAGREPRADDIISLNTELPEVALGPCLRYLQREDRPAAVLASNGAILMGLWEAAGRLGISVPGQLSIIGSDSAGARLHPVLSTFNVPRRRLARTAVELLLAIASQGGSAVQDQVLECPLDLKGSTGPAPPSCADGVSTMA